ncbi:GntR family transcriptional regulator [Bounagaea algeriensis]
MGSPSDTKRNQIFDEIRRLILVGQLERGARLRQDELARRFHASITPVREALRLLEADGLVVSEPHRGVRVAGVDLEQIKATYILRRLSESYAMRRATLRVSRRDMATARNLLDQMQQAQAVEDPAAIREANKQFHFFFYDRCGVPALSQQIEAMWQAFPWDLLLNSPERAAASHQEHRVILDAVRAGDPDRVAEATEAHIRRGYIAITEHLSGEEGVDPFDLEAD